MEKSRVSGGQCPHALRVLSQLTEQHCEDIRTRIIVGAIALGKIWNAKNGMLEDSGRIGHPREMTQLQLRQFPRFLVERLRGKRFSRPPRPLYPCQLERTHIQLCYLSPDHLPAEPVGVLSSAMTARVFAQQA